MADTSITQVHGSRLSRPDASERRGHAELWSAGAGITPTAPTVTVNWRARPTGAGPVAVSCGRAVSGGRIAQPPDLGGTQDADSLGNDVVRRGLVIGGHVPLSAGYDFGVRDAAGHVGADPPAVAEGVVVREVEVAPSDDVVGVLNFGCRNGIGEFNSSRPGHSCCTTTGFSAARGRACSRESAGTAPARAPTNDSGSRRIATLPSQGLIIGSGYHHGQRHRTARARRCRALRQPREPTPVQPCHRRTP